MNIEIFTSSPFIHLTSGSGSPPYLISKVITCPFLMIMFWRPSPIMYGLTAKIIIFIRRYLMMKKEQN